MKKFFLPIALMLSCVLASCSADDDFIVDDDQDFSSWTIEGSPDWLQRGFTSIYADDDSAAFLKYLLSSNIFSYYMQWDIAKVHDVDSKQYVSLSVAYGTPVENTLIVPEKFNTERVIHSDASTDIRRIGYYDILTKCFTPGGKEITNEKLIQQILSTPGRDIYCDQGSLFSIITDRLYGFDDCARWIKPHFADSLKAMCEERFNKYGDRFFWGTIGQYVINISREECLDDADTDGRGTPFVLETFIINGDHTLTRYLESFIAAEDGAISPLPFNDVTEIMSTKFGISNFDPYHNPDFYNTKSGIIPVYY